MTIVLLKDNTVLPRKEKEKKQSEMIHLGREVVLAEGRGVDPEAEEVCLERVITPRDTKDVEGVFQELGVALERGVCQNIEVDQGIEGVAQTVKEVVPEGVIIGDVVLETLGVTSGEGEVTLGVEEQLHASIE